MVFRWFGCHFCLVSFPAVSTSVVAFVVWPGQVFCFFGEPAADATLYAMMAETRPHAALPWLALVHSFAVLSATLWREMPRLKSSHLVEDLLRRHERMLLRRYGPLSEWPEPADVAERLLDLQHRRRSAVPGPSGTPIGDIFSPKGSGSDDCFPKDSMDIFAADLDISLLAPAEFSPQDSPLSCASSEHSGMESGNDADCESVPTVVEEAGPKSVPLLLSLGGCFSFFVRYQLLHCFARPSADGATRKQSISASMRSRTLQLGFCGFFSLPSSLSQETPSPLDPADSPWTRRYKTWHAEHGRQIMAQPASSFELDPIEKASEDSSAAVLASPEQEK